MSSDSGSFTSSDSGSIENQLDNALENENAIAAAGKDDDDRGHGQPEADPSRDSSCGFNAESPDEHSLSEELEARDTRGRAGEDRLLESLEPVDRRVASDNNVNDVEANHVANEPAETEWGAINSPYVESTRSDGRDFELRSLSRKLCKKAARRGFDFKLMLVGESGIGKTTLIDSLFNVESTRNLGSQYVRSQRSTARTTKLCERFFELEEGGVSVRLTVIDTPGFATELDSTECVDPVLGYVERQLDEYYRLEQGMDRSKLRDDRVHCLLYLINPSGRGLKPIDVLCMKALHTKVNIVPVIGKADTLTPSEKANLKAWILQDITRHGISVYTLPEFNDCFGHPDQAEDDFYLRNQYESLKSSMPLAVVGSNLQVQDSEGRWTRAREYPWGIVDIDNPEFSDFLKLRELLIMYMEDFKDRTHEVIYEQIRLCKLRQTDWHMSRMSKTIAETERLLREKNEELHRLREEVELAKRSSKSSSLPAASATTTPQAAERASTSSGGRAPAAAAAAANSARSFGGAGSYTTSGPFVGPFGDRNYGRGRGSRHSQLD